MNLRDATYEFAHGKLVRVRVLDDTTPNGTITLDVITGHGGLSTYVRLEPSQYSVGGWAVNPADLNAAWVTIQREPPIDTDAWRNWYLRKHHFGAELHRFASVRA